MTLGPDNVEILWSVVGLVLLALTAAVLVASYRRNELGWFLIVLLLPPVGMAAYALRYGHARAGSRTA